MEINYKAIPVFVIFILVIIYAFISKEGSFAENKYNKDNHNISFLIENSDLIAIVNINRAIKEDTGKANLFFSPKSATAKIIKIINGNEPDTLINISAYPSILEKDTIWSKLALRNGEHLVFLKRDNEIYKPTTSMSLLDINQNRVYPSWRDDHYKEETDGTHWSSGVEITSVIREIKNKI